MDGCSLDLKETGLVSFVLRDWLEKNQMRITDPTKRHVMMQLLHKVELAAGKAPGSHRDPEEKTSPFGGTRR